jgi:hypothetical protein
MTPIPKCFSSSKDHTHYCTGIANIQLQPAVADIAFAYHLKIQNLIRADNSNSTGYSSHFHRFDFFYYSHKVPCFQQSTTVRIHP